MTHVHFIGIGGAGLSAIARLLLESGGYTVSGSDAVNSPVLDALSHAGARVFIGQDAAHVQGADWVVRSSAVSDENPEVVTALASGIPVYKRSDFIGKLMEDRVGIGVAGTHGKTTTSAMISWILHGLQRDPSFIVGGMLTNLGVNAHAGQGREFVIEADEYDRMFLGLRPTYAVVTNLEHDHPDCYPTPADLYAAFVEYVGLISPNGALIACAEDPGAQELMASARKMGKRVIGYRISADGRTEAGEGAIARGLRPNTHGGFSFDVIIRLQGQVQYISSVELRVPGLHNVRNALAALTVAVLAGAPGRDAAAVLARFTGTGRRFEVKGEAQGVIVVDDYAHHPTEIRATLAAARVRYIGRQLWVVWQPHTYSRTHTLFDEFVMSFAEADHVLVSEIYAAREPREDFSSAEVVRAMKHPDVHFIPALDDIRDYLLQNLKRGDVLLVLSAGDADRVSREVLAQLHPSA